MFLWKKNILSDIAEQTFISTAIAMSLTAAAGQIRANGITPLLQGKILMLAPIVLGLVVYAQFFKKYAFLQRWSVALVVGTGMGVVIVTSVETSILKNLTSTILPVVNVEPGVMLNDLLMIIATFCTVSYFLFTRPRVGTLGRVQHLGRYLMMIYFGASFGSFVMTRLSMFISVINIFLKNLGIVS
jgi:hypothetical protein